MMVDLQKNLIGKGSNIEKTELSTVSFNEASLVPQALFCRWFQPTVLNTGGKASSSVGFIPFHYNNTQEREKGLKPTEESGKTGRFIYPSVETDGKIEPAAWDTPLKKIVQL